MSLFIMGLGVGKMGWQIDSGTLIELIGEDLRKEANDNTAADTTGLVDQVLRASSAASEKGLWSLAELFREWAYELHCGPQRTLCPMTAAVMIEGDSQSVGVGLGEKMPPQ